MNLQLLNLYDFKLCKVSLQLITQNILEIGV